MKKQNKFLKKVKEGWTETEVEHLIEVIENYIEEKWYAYISSTSKFYCLKDKWFKSINDVKLSIWVELWITWKSKAEKIVLAQLPQMFLSYQWISFWIEDKPWYFNICDTDQILTASDNPVKHEYFDTLLNNLSNNNDWKNVEQKEYLEKIILYKATHADNPVIPCIVFHWGQWTWKWTFVNLMRTIFSHDYTSMWLLRENLISQFSANDWTKFVIEFSEIFSENVAQDNLISNKLKSLIYNPTITVNQKWIQQYNIDNHCMYIISSNHKDPIRLDRGVWKDRRYSVLCAYWELWDIWQKINEIVNSKEHVSNYLARLEKKYPEVVTMTDNFPVLENEDKENLKAESQDDTDIFFQYLEEKYWYWHIISVKDVRDEAVKWSEESWIWDPLTIHRYLWKWPKYSNKRRSIRINWVVKKAIKLYETIK